MTAEEFLDANTSGTIDELKCKELMIAFAKYHVEQALKVASYSAETKDEQVYTGGLSNGVLYELYRTVDEESILNAYPLDLIK
jgi:hypothetical protein